VNANHAQSIKQLFAEASERLGEEREQFLRWRCGNDAAVRAAVERLLLADAGGGDGFLAAKHPPPRETSVPAQVGRFRLVRKIGEGGMGAVFEAEQDQPLRKVALKMVRQAALSEPLLRRFEYEVQILGQLRHPGIAQIYDAGTHDDGATTIPYFAMEFVDGQPLMDFIKRHRLTVRQRLRLMAAICDAVHHAHQKGVVHRDLKPSNILIEGSGDGVPQPKILDFGVARAIHSDVRLVTMHTEVGQLVGTLSYMSPEQVAGRPDELDVRSDVYALGVILYEMLADRLPYDLRNLSIPEAGSVIRDRDPTQLSSIDTSLRGDVETIAFKALAKERERRYQSAAEFADDIRRFLTDEPITARPASRVYHLRKFAQRNKGLVGGAAVAFAVLLVAIAGISIALVRATHAEQAALRSATRANAVSKFLQNMLAGVDPEEIGPNALTVREVLDLAGARLEEELSGQPEVAAAVHHTLGRHYSTLGHYVDGDRHLRRAVELRRTFTQGDDAELAEALTDLSTNLQDKRDIAEAEAPTREALDMRRRLFGRESLEAAESLHEIAFILIETGRAREAEPLARESLAIRRLRLGEENAAVATGIGTLGWCLLALGRLDEAETAMREAADMVRRLPGFNGRMLAGRLTFLAAALRAQGKNVEEEMALREAIDIRSRRLAQDHPSLAWNLFCLAKVRWKLGDHDEAETTCRRALDIYTKKREPQHTDIADCQELLAQIYDDRGRLVEAEPLWSACLEIRRQVLPPEHPDIAFAENALARSRAAQHSARGIPARAGQPLR
jgi:tetratricopeptide (TPR) repeat protein/tRNA A-37 threonylcarbamoyl transferase component Bud32